LKFANIIPIPEAKPAREVNKNLRPISLIPILSKIAEDYVVNLFVKPTVLKKIDPNQYGTVPRSSTTQALISMLHFLNASTDGNGATTRVILFDYKKAFDLIDHRLLLDKLGTGHKVEGGGGGAMKIDFLKTGLQ
jgi:retron-type reverse transcriptase